MLVRLVHVLRVCSACLALFLVACSATPERSFGLIPVSAPASEPDPAPSAPTQHAPYRIQPGDELEIRFFHTPDQNVTVPVRPDGFISMPLVYEVLAAGRTVEDLRRELVERCSQELAAPEISVIVRTFSGYLVHVGGEVNDPRVLEITGTRTVLQAIFEAGGFLPTASPENVIVVRCAPDGRYELAPADMEAVLTGKNSDGNFPLRPYDIVFVPSSAIANVNKWVDQYIRENIPVSLSVGYRLDD